MRLNDHELRAIKDGFQQNFLNTDTLWIFGSRVDDEKRGGDIDLYIETTLSAKDAVQAKIRYSSDLMINIGEQRIDIVLNLVHDENELQIYKIAKCTGIQLI